MSNLWIHRIFKEDGGKPLLVAEYVSETTPESVKSDLLLLKRSRLQNHLAFQGVNAAEYVSKFALRAEALLGGLKAKSVCSLTFGVWLSLEPPPTKKIGEVPDGAKLVLSEDGVRVWQVKVADQFASGTQDF